MESAVSVASPMPDMRGTAQTNCRLRNVVGLQSAASSVVLHVPLYLGCQGDCASNPIEQGIQPQKYPTKFGPHLHTHQLPAENRVAVSPEGLCCSRLLETYLADPSTKPMCILRMFVFWVTSWGPVQVT